ncbi:MAG: GntR family transcriptional regulator [Clostridia bacterium]|nr:GntR family transcriptional regulator [Clostridia bacterium]
MDNLYHFDPDIKVPIYQQLANSIRASIKSGKMPAGTRLPTVRELADMLQVAQGTVKRTYDELESEQLIKKAQGRGTFVCYSPAPMGSRKDKALAAIDRALSEMEDMGFSLSEINIFLNLKLRELAAHQENIKVAIIECNREVMDQLQQQLHKLENIDLYTSLLSEMESYPYSISEDMDIIVTTQTHAEAVEGLIQDKHKLAKIALRMASTSVKQIVKLEPGEHAGILCASERFGSLIRHACLSFTDNVTISQPEVFSDVNRLESFLMDKTALLLPDGYERYCSADIHRRLQRFAHTGKVILCHYKIDEGSLMYLEEKIDRLAEKKSI